MTKTNIKLRCYSRIMAGGSFNEEDEAINSEMRRIVSEEVAKAMGATIPGYMEDLQRSLKEFMHQELAEIRVVEETEKTTKRVTYKEFVACKPTEFNGEVDPLVAQRWVLDMESAFETSHCDPSDEVIYAGNQLRLRGKDWWELLRKEKGRDGIKSMTWKEFKELFLKRFCPQAAVNRIQEEFLQLRQKDEDIDTITATFYDKAKFCPDLLRTERMWINQYYGILSAKYREFLMPSKCETLAELIDCAREREAELKRQVDRGEKRSLEKDEGSSKKAKFSHPPKKSNQIKEFRTCSNCGKKHPGECLLPPKIYFKCGKPGHLATQCTSTLELCFNCYKPGHRKSECPSLRSGGSSSVQGSMKKLEAPKPTGRAFQITAEEAKKEFEVVTGTFLLNSLPAYVLFDSGANRSFVSVKFASHASFVLSKLEIPLEVEVADSKTFVVFDIFFLRKV